MAMRPWMTAGLVGAVVALCTVRAAGDPVDPWDFNVFSLGDIGTPTAKYHSDFQGVAGAGGSAYFSGFSLHDVPGAGLPGYFSLCAGGDVELTGAIRNGGIEAAGNISILGASVDGPIVGGADLLGTGGMIAGDVTLAGRKLAGLPVTIHGDLWEGVPFEPALDLSATASFFSRFSATVGAMEPTTLAENRYGELRIKAESGVNVVEIDTLALASAWGVRLEGPADATVFINVPDDTANFRSLVWSYRGGIDNEHALLNLPAARALDLQGGNHRINILAPNAQTHFDSGLVTGNLVVGSLTGGGQVNAGSFEGSVPEPSALATVLLSGLMVFRRRRD